MTLATRCMAPQSQTGSTSRMNWESSPESAKPRLEPIAPLGGEGWRGMAKVSVMQKCTHGDVVA